MFRGVKTNLAADHGAKGVVIYSDPEDDGNTRGTVYPDEIVQVGAHHDAWTYGSDDNLSGAAAVLQIARGLHNLEATGWRAARTITLGAWDGEEYGLKVERQLLVSRGLPGRPRFRHQIYAPGVNSGDGTQVLPAVNDALFLRHNTREAQRYGATLHRSLTKVTRTLQ